jgi:acyl-CoA reductase-like NAD-dependent aldehyde dehydrogenase
MPSPTTMAEWQAKADSLVLPRTHYIDGRFSDSASPDRFETTNPATGEILACLPAGIESDVGFAVQAARRAFDDQRWRGKTIAERKAILLTVADLIEQSRDEFALIEALEVGKAIGNAQSEIAMSLDWLRYYAEAIDKVYGAVAPSDGDLFAFSLVEPRGVVGAIVPWNFPLANAITKAAPALAAGNSIVLKPSEVASLSALRLAELMTQAGLPSGVFNVVLGLGTTVGAAIARHPDIDFLSFTGSTGTGRALMRYAGESNGKPLMLECGGKSPQLICADMVDEIPSLAAKIVRDAFWNQGQWCSARTRLIIVRDIYERVLEAVAAEAKKLVPGEPLDPGANFGTISSAAQFDRIRSYIEVGKREGARLALDGAAGAPCRLSQAPTIFADVAPSMRIAQEEIFGPVLSAMPASDFDDAIAKANDTAYGLSATLWTHDTRAAMRAVRSIRAGRIVVRSTTAATGSSGVALAAEPFAASGFGVEKGLEGLRAYCRTRAVEIL